MIDSQEIQRMLPHRYPFLLVDRVEAIEDQSITAFKNVSINEPFFQGHFPEQSIMPGVLIIEAMAQVAGIYIKDREGRGDGDPLFYLAGVDDARFKRMVLPGDRLDMTVTFIKQRRQLWQFDAKAHVADQLACSCRLLVVNANKT